MSEKPKPCTAHAVGTRPDWDYRTSKPRSGIARENDDTEADELIEVFDFCPLCGADLRGKP